jgi:REP element-mobilizing transposase RayT
VGLQRYVEASLKQPPFEMDEDQRAVALEAIREVCRHRQWQLLAANIRTNHVHTVVDAGGAVAPEFIMNTFKSYASRAFNLREPRQLRWARHGSTRYLVSRDEIEAAVRYDLEKQGEPMALFEPPCVSMRTEEQ